MSRWITSYESHPIKNSWNQFGETLRNFKISDESNQEAIFEIARLKKVFDTFSDLTEQFDPELLPENYFHQSNKWIAQATIEINAYIANQNIAHLQNANQQIDQFLTFLKPPILLSGKSRKIFQDAMRGYAETIQQFNDNQKDKIKSLIDDLQSEKEKFVTLQSEVEAIREKVFDYESEIFGSEENPEGIKQKITEIENDFEQRKESIESYYDRLFQGEGSTPSIEYSVNDAKERIVSDRQEISDLLENVKSDIENLNDFHTKIFGKEEVEGKRKGGLSEDFNSRIAALKSFEEKQALRYNTLNNQIESLLPRATSAGLAHAYGELKVSFAKPIQNASRLFYASLAGIVAGSIIFSIHKVGGENWLEFNGIGSWEAVLQGILFKLPFIGPLLWLALYASKRRSEYSRLEQEYAHKEALAKSYDSYKQQLEALGDSDNSLRTELIKKAMDAIAYNASITLDKKHGDKMPLQEVVEKSIEGVLKALPELGKVGINAVKPK